MSIGRGERGTLVMKASSGNSSSESCKSASISFAVLRVTLAEPLREVGREKELDKVEKRGVLGLDTGDGEKTAEF